MPRPGIGSGRAWPWPFKVAVAVATLVMTGCFSPREVPCAFTCIAVDARCPEGYVCGGDGLCHNENAADEPGVCLLKTPDPGAGGTGGESASSK
jgi:hypothetical protein